MVKYNFRIFSILKENLKKRTDQEKGRIVT